MGSMGSMGSIPPLERQASNMTIASIPGGAEDEAVEEVAVARLSDFDMRLLALLLRAATEAGKEAIDKQNFAPSTISAVRADGAPSVTNQDCELITDDTVTFLRDALRHSGAAWNGHSLEVAPYDADVQQQVDGSPGAVLLPGLVDFDVRLLEPVLSQMPNVDLRQGAPASGAASRPKISPRGADVCAKMLLLP